MRKSKVIVNGVGVVILGILLLVIIDFGTTHMIIQEEMKSDGLVEGIIDVIGIGMVEVFMIFLGVLVIITILVMIVLNLKLKKL